MNRIRYVTGDATQPSGNGLKIIAHVCNDQGGWGAGFVLALSKRWPNPEAAFRKWADDGPLKLGAVQFVAAEPDIWVANMIGQHGIGTKRGIPPIRYEAVEKALGRVGEKARELGASVHAPRFGAGLAGGEWDCIADIIERTLVHLGIAVTIYDLPKRA